MSFKFESSDYTLEEALFGVHQLRVPQFQRPYTWEEDQCNDFWNDLVDDDTFFLGQFILNYEYLTKEKFVDIVDGQQRTTSILILCAALRDKAKALGFSDEAEVIQDNVMLAKRNFSGPQYKITVSPTLKDFFETYIQSGKNEINMDIDSDLPEEIRVVKNYLYFKERLSEHLQELSPSEQLKEIIRLFEFIKSAQIIVTKIHDENDAYEIFESVNATGVELNVADLLKNFLFKKIKQEGGETNEVSEKWAELLDLTATSDIDITKFIRYYWLSKYEFVSEAKLFKAIKTKNISNWKGFLQDILDNARIFYDLRNPLEADFSSIRKDQDKVRNALIGIREMNITQCYVLLLCIYRNREIINTNWQKIFELIEKFNFLYHTTAKLPANRVEKLYQEYSSKIESLLRKEKDKSTIKISIEKEFNELIAFLKRLIPNEEIFTLGFVEINYKKRGLCRYILSKIEDDKGTKEYVLNHPTISIEHILPQRPGKEWHLTQKEIRGYVHNIGNLTLLGKKPNNLVGNKSVIEKMKILETSTEIKMTRDLVEQFKKKAVWNEKTIRNRANELAKIAYNEVWKI